MRAKAITAVFINTMILMSTSLPVPFGGDKMIMSSEAIVHRRAGGIAPPPYWPYTAPGAPPPPPPPPPGKGPGEGSSAFAPYSKKRPKNSDSSDSEEGPPSKIQATEKQAESHYDPGNFDHIPDCEMGYDSCLDTPSQPETPAPPPPESSTDSGSESTPSPPESPSPPNSSTNDSPPPGSPDSEDPCFDDTTDSGCLSGDDPDAPPVTTGGDGEPQGGTGDNPPDGEGSGPEGEAGSGIDPAGEVPEPPIDPVV